MKTRAKATHSPITFTYRGLVRELDAETSAKLRRLAKKQGVSVSSLVVRVLNDALEHDAVSI